MDIHVALPNGHRGVTLDQLTEITEVAEELGFAGVWPLDHVLVGPDLKDRYPWVIEPMTLLGYLAARTSRIRLGTSVIVLGMRNPFVVAKQAATLDLLSGGRVDFAAGRGYDAKEYGPFGVPFDQSAALFAEGLEIVWRAWTEPGTWSHRGEFYRFDDIEVRPRPALGLRLRTRGC